MPNVEEDTDREERIAMEIVVDAYTEEEVNLGWYCYLDNKIDTPFQAKWITQGRKSASSTQVEVTGMADEEECQEDMFINIRYRDGEIEDIFSVPLTDIEPLNASRETLEAIADWHYWVDRGYQ